MRYLIGLLLIQASLVSASDVSEYLLEYKISGRSDFMKETSIINAYPTNTLIEELNPFVSDTLSKVRQKAYYLIYKKGMTVDLKDKTIVVNQLLKACQDNNGGIVGQNIGFLQEFPKDAFEPTAKNQIELLLIKKRMPHYKQLVLLAGYLGVGEEKMRQKLLQQETSNEKKWAYSLALARQGDTLKAEYCVGKVRELEMNNDIVNYIIPDLIYTRQRVAINYCLEILQSEKEDCRSLDPDKSINILCGYFVMEQLAPVIKSFPYTTDATGSLQTTNYKAALTAIRKWFVDNPNYQILTDSF